MAGSALTVLEDGKIPTKKVKVGVKTSHFLCDTFALLCFLGGIFLKKTHNLHCLSSNPVLPKNCRFVFFVCNSTYQRLASKEKYKYLGSLDRPAGWLVEPGGAASPLLLSAASSLTVTHCSVKLVDKNLHLKYFSSRILSSSFQAL